MMEIVSSSFLTRVVNSFGGIQILEGGELIRWKVGKGRRIF